MHYPRTWLKYCWGVAWDMEPQRCCCSSPGAAQHPPRDAGGAPGWRRKRGHPHLIGVKARILTRSGSPIPPLLLKDF